MTIHLPDFIEWVDAVNILLCSMIGHNIEDTESTRQWRWDAAYCRGLTPSEAIAQWMIE